MNVRCLVWLAAMLLPCLPVWGQDNVIDEVVWVVGDEAILKSEVEEYISQIRSDVPGRMSVS